MNVKKRKLALALCFVMLFSCIIPLQVNSDTKVEAAKKKTLEGNVDYYVGACYESPKVGATYSVSISNKKVLSFGRAGTTTYNSLTDEIFKKPAFIAVLKTLKKGNSTVKIKQTYKGKTKVVATYNVKVKDRQKADSYYCLSNSSCAQRQKKTEYVDNEGVTVTRTENEYYLQLEKGATIPWETYFYGDEKTASKITVADTSIASIGKDGVLTAKKAGETKLVLKKSNEVEEKALVVVPASQDATMKKARDISSKLNKLYKKKLTVKNVIKNYNTWVSYCNQLKALSPDKGDLSSKQTVLNTCKYSSTQFVDKFCNVAKKKCYAITTFGVSLEGVKIKSATTKKVKFSAKKAVTKYDVLYSKAAHCKKITNKSKLGYLIDLNTNSYYGEVSVGKKGATLKSSYTTAKKGKTLYSITDNKGKTKIYSCKIK